jgi:hypothetical protein
LWNNPKELSTGGYAALVLFLDEQSQIDQANLTYVTIVRTVAGTTEELTRYFSDYRFRSEAVATEGKGSYQTEPDSKAKVFTLSWETDFDLSVYDRIDK